MSQPSPPPPYDRKKSYFSDHHPRRAQRGGILRVGIEWDGAMNHKKVRTHIRRSVTPSEPKIPICFPHHDLNTRNAKAIINEIPWHFQACSCLDDAKIVFPNNRRSVESVKHLDRTQELNDMFYRQLMARLGGRREHVPQISVSIRPVHLQLDANPGTSTSSTC